MPTGDIGSRAFVDKIIAKPGQTVNWTGVTGHTYTIAIFDERVFVGGCLVAARESLPLSSPPEVAPDAPYGRHEYIIYDETDGLFVMGRSHPKIEIPKP